MVQSDSSHAANNWDRFLPASGIGFALVLVAAVVGVFAGGAEPNDPFHSVAKTLVGERDALLIRYAFQLGASGLFVLFLASLTARLEAAEGRASTLTRGAYAAGLIGVLLITVTDAINAALAASIAPVAGDGAVWAVFQAGQAIFTFAAMFIGLFLLCASEVIRRTRALPRWVAYLGLVAGVAYVIGSFSVADQRGPAAIPAIAGFVLFIAWCLSASVVLLVRNARIPAVGEGLRSRSELTPDR